MNFNYPIVLKDVFSSQKFFQLRDELNYGKWQLKNYSDPGHDEKSEERVSWTIENMWENIIMYECASIIKLKIQKYLQQNLIFIRAHSNGSTFGQSSRFHIDFISDDIWTFILFTEKNWNTQWGGEFVVHNPIEEKYNYISYIPNSGVLIPSNWQHYAMSPNEGTDKLRTTLAFSYCSTESFGTIKHLTGVKRFL
jgi:hypothetical protein